MIYSVTVEKQNSFGRFVQAWRDVYTDLNKAKRRCSELNGKWLRKKQLDHRAFVDVHDEKEILGTCEICDEPVIEGDEFGNELGLFNHPVHRWCPKTLDPPQFLYPSIRR